MRTSHMIQHRPSPYSRPAPAFSLPTVGFFSPEYLAAAYGKPSPDLLVQKSTVLNGKDVAAEFNITLNSDGNIGKVRKIRRRGRTAFTDHQLNQLSCRFQKQQYLDMADRVELAASLGLTAQIVKIWFQNRRCMYKKVMKASGGESTGDLPPLLNDVQGCAVDAADVTTSGDVPSSPTSDLVDSESTPDKETVAMNSPSPAAGTTDINPSPVSQSTAVRLCKLENLLEESAIYADTVSNDDSTSTCTPERLSPLSIPDSLGGSLSPSSSASSVSPPPVSPDAAFYNHQQPFHQYPHMYSHPFPMMNPYTQFQAPTYPNQQFHQYQSSLPPMYNGNIYQNMFNRQ